MKRKTILVLLTILSLSCIAGCKNNNNINLADTDVSDYEEIYDDTDEASELVTSASTTLELSGDYDSIFNNEIITMNDYSDVTVVIGGFEYLIDDNTYCKYFEEIGPVFLLGSHVQYKVKTLDKTYDEILSSDISEKAVSMGYEIVHKPERITSGNNDYVYFEYIFNGDSSERCIGINLPSPDDNKVIAVQMSILDEDIEIEDAINGALTVVQSATVTDKEDTTEEEIKDLYTNSSFITGVRIQNGSISADDSTYTFSVPDEFRLTSDTSEPDFGMQSYNSKDISLTLQYAKNNSFSDARRNIECLMLWCDGDSQSDVTAALNGTSAYATYYISDYDIYGINASMFTEDGYIVTVMAERTGSKLEYDDIVGFFNVGTGTKQTADTTLKTSTAIMYDQMYLGSVSDFNYATNLITQYGQMQRERYTASQTVKDIEKSLEEKYDIAAVNLGEIDDDTAKDIEKGVSYMFDTYPILKGSLNTITLGNFKQNESTFVALTQTVDFIVEDEMGSIPKVVRNEIVLNANNWLNRDEMMDMCKENVASGYWFKNAKDPSKVIVHELGHQLLDVLIAKEYSYYDVYNNKIIYMPCLLTKKNEEAYLDYYWSKTALNQTYETQYIQDCYNEWLDSGHTGSEEDFRKSISSYANGLQSDGGVSYQETFAEAVADVYCNGDNASDASKIIVSHIEQ